VGSNGVCRADTPVAGLTWEYVWWHRGEDPSIGLERPPTPLRQARERTSRSAAGIRYSKSTRVVRAVAVRVVLTRDQR
jgi:hypothetical protein